MILNDALSNKKNSYLDTKTRIIEITRGKNGYGFTLSGQAPCFVSWIVRSSPAEQIGLCVGDYVISVNGKDVSSSSHEVVVKLIGVSFGTLLLGVCSSIDGISKENKTLTPEMSFTSQHHNKQRADLNEAPQSFSRTEKVLEDLHSGALFRSMSSSSDDKSRDNFKTTVVPVASLVVVQSVVAYLGTVEMQPIGPELLEELSLETVDACVQQLRVEQHIHQRVLMKVTQSCVKLSNADGDTIAVYKSERIRFGASSPHDGRFFCVVTAQEDLADLSSTMSYSCHIFMVDPDVSSHSAHADKAKRFGIQCSTGDSGDCVEFPRSPRSLLAVIRLLYFTANKPLRKSCKRSPLDGNYNYNNSSLREDHRAPPSTPPVHVVDEASRSGLSRGESSLSDCIRISWSESAHKHNKSQSRLCSHNSTDNADKLNPRALFASDCSAEGSSDSVATTSSSLNLPARVKVAHHRATHRQSATDESGVLLLNHANLVQHDKLNLPANIPPAMHKLSMGKYRVPDTRYSSGSLGRISKKSQVEARHPLTKRSTRLLPSHLMNNGKLMSKSFESSGSTGGYRSPLLNRQSTRTSLQNVTGSDDDPMSAASSIESLASNASLPSCVNASLTGFHDNGRPTLMASSSTGDDVSAGRISHWAVSFDRLLDDPLGVKYFKEFLRKEFSEENILFWEACEDLRKSSQEDEEKLKETISSIYERFLASDASMSVNIDSHGQQLAEEALASRPNPSVFLNQQHQIYTLMRLDSYSRFLKSSLYRQCMVSEMEGRPLPLDRTDWSNPDPEAFRRPARSIDSGSLHRKSKKDKASKKGIFSFKNRSKSQRETNANMPLSRQSSGTGESSGSESGFPVTRAASLPGNSSTFPDPSRVCHVTLWDNTSTVLYPRKAGGTTVGEALGDLCENRGVRLSALDVYLAEDYTASNEGKQKRPLSLDLDVAVLASQSIVLERRSLFRLDMLPVKRSVGVKARPSKSIADVLKPVLNKYHLELENVLIKDCADQKELSLEKPVSSLDGMRILVEGKPDEAVKDEEVPEKLRKKHPALERKGRSSNKGKVPNKKDTEELLDLMSSLQNSKLNDQRGLISEADLELPDFLKLKPINDNSNNNVINGSVTLASSAHGETSREQIKASRIPGSRKQREGKCYVELNTQPHELRSFKPNNATAHFRSSSSEQNQSRPSSEDDDINDTTIVEDPVTLEGDFDPNTTLKPLPTPPNLKQQSGVDTSVLPMADFPPPTPISKQTKSFTSNI